MKKKILFILLVLMMFLTVACSKAEIVAEKQKALEKENTSKKEETKKENTKENTKKSEYINASYLDGVDKYVTALDPKIISIFSKNTFKEIDERDYNSEDYRNKYTGECKSYYVSNLSENCDTQIRVRLPYLVENSKLADQINSEIKDFFADECLDELQFMNIDYDAYIYQDILSIKIEREVMYEGMEGSDMRVLKTYNFDISSDNLVLLSNEEMLNRINTSTELIKNFGAEYLYSELYRFLENFYDDFMEIENNIHYCMEVLDFDYETNKLFIYKNTNNDYYSLEFNYAFTDTLYGYTKYYHITLADSEAKMAMLSKPDDAIGVIYKSKNKENMPVKGLVNEDVKLQVLNADKAEDIIYFASYFDTGINICELMAEQVYLGGDENVYTEKWIPLDYPVKNENGIWNIYEFHTSLDASEIPKTAVRTSGTWRSDTIMSADEPILGGLYSDSHVQYIYPTIAVNEYEYKNDKLAIKINLQENGEFVTSGDWKDISIPITKGRYASDRYYCYIFPCADDITKGAADYYVLKKEDFGSLYFVYSSEKGNLEMSDKELIFYCR